MDSLRRTTHYSQSDIDQIASLSTAHAEKSLCLSYLNDANHDTMDGHQLTVRLKNGALLRTDTIFRLSTARLFAMHN